MTAPARAAATGRWKRSAAAWRRRRCPSPHNGLLAAPPSQDFENWPGTAGNNTNTLEIDGLRYATSSTGIIDVINVADIYGQTFPGFSGRAISNDPGGAGPGSNFFELSAIDLANNFS